MNVLGRAGRSACCGGGRSSGWSCSGAGVTSSCSSAAIIVLEILAYQIGSAHRAAPSVRRDDPRRVERASRCRRSPVAAFAVTSIGMAYTLVVPGRPRDLAKWVDRGRPRRASRLRACTWRSTSPTDAAFGAILGVAVALDRVPLVHAERGVPGHVPARQGRAPGRRRAPRRGDRHAPSRTSSGSTVLEIKPVGLEGSGGSTPLRLTVVDAPTTSRTATCSRSSTRRTTSAPTAGTSSAARSCTARSRTRRRSSRVRRFVEYEDYTLRLMHDAGSRPPKPYGIVEITPEREYMIVMEFFDGRRRDRRRRGRRRGDRRRPAAGPAACGTPGSRTATSSRRTSWCATASVLLIDVFFVQVRPSPWRQAVDLANMMLVLALRTDAAARVRARARSTSRRTRSREAFAATRGVASPTQLRSMMKQDGRDLLGEFRALAPERRADPDPAMERPPGRAHGRWSCSCPCCRSCCW